jgi:hypothetical protein
MYLRLRPCPPFMGCICPVLKLCVTVLLLSLIHPCRATWINAADHFCQFTQTRMLTYSLHEAESFFRSWQVLSYSKYSPHFMEPEGSLPRLQEPANCPYPEPDQSSPCPPSHFLNIYSYLNIILPSTSGFSKWSVSLRFHTHTHTNMNTYAAIFATLNVIQITYTRRSFHMYLLLLVLYTVLISNSVIRHRPIAVVKLN